VRTGGIGPDAARLSRFPDDSFSTLKRRMKLRLRSLTLLSSLCEGCPRHLSQALAKDFP
jgi:hypothetical protein